MSSGPQIPPAEDIPLHSSVATPQPKHPNVRFNTDIPEKLNHNDWTDLSNQLYLSINAAIAARGTLEANLKDWSDAYDLIIGEKDWPFQVSANISLPYSAGQLESMVAYIAGTVLVPRLYMVTGNTPIAAGNAFKVEKYYNAELLRLRSDGSSYYARHVDYLHMSLRDGTCVMECLWNRKRHRKESVTFIPKTDAQGQMVLEKGVPVWEERKEVVDVYVADYPELTPVPLKEFMLIPAEAPSIQEAAAVARCEWLYEDQLNRYVAAGLMDSDEVERALVYVDNGVSEVPSDRQGYYDKDASQQLGVGLGQGPVGSKYFKNRGPIKVWRIHSSQYDLNQDGEVEENVFWLHEQGQRMLGFMPYDYADGQRPFFAFSPFPRPGSFYGFSLIERLSGVQIEMNANHNARQDQIAFRMCPPMAVTEGSTLLTKRGSWRPGMMFEVETPGGPNASFQMLDIKDVPVSSWQEETLLKQYGSEYTGLSNPTMGAQSSGRRSATEMRQQSASAGTRLALISMRFRIAAGQIINFQHQLNKQYLRDDPQTMIDNQVYTLPLEILAQDYTIGVAGATDPIDSATRRNEALALYEIATQNPLIAQSPLRLWYATRDLFETFGKANVYQLIGTEQDAQKLDQQAKQMQAQQAQQGGPPQGQHPQPHHQQSKHPAGPPAGGLS